MPSQDLDKSERTDHPLSLYNSLTRKVERFVPLVTVETGEMPSVERPVTMYNCGPTVYSYAHIGNARAAVVADVLFRLLRHIYGEDHVIYARNITDVDDRIIASATEQGVEISEITEKYARIYNEDLAALNCLPPTEQPKATEHIGGMIELISTLLDKDIAYASDGHVFFDVSKYDDYGKLSGNTLDALRGGDRVGEGEVARKKNAADFVLWKPELNGVGWDAPFGRGRPGWHIECSAMAKATLAETIDIHCGGIDLKFPHHENEIAQSNCAHDKPMARYWVHNEFLNMGKDKMSKSLGNVLLVHDLLEHWDGEVIRLALLKAHYRNELLWSEDLLSESKAQLDGWYEVYKNSNYSFSTSSSMPSDIKKYIHLVRFEDCLNRDIDLNYMLNSINAKKIELNGLIKTYETGPSAFFNSFALKAGEIEPSDEIKLEIIEKRIYLDRVVFRRKANIIGLLQKDPEDWFSGNASDDDKARFDALAAARHAARSHKDWAEADRIRDEGAALGIVFEDGKDGTSWRKA